MERQQTEEERKVKEKMDREKTETRLEKQRNINEKKSTGSSDTQAAGGFGTGVRPQQAADQNIAPLQSLRENASTPARTVVATTGPYAASTNNFEQMKKRSRWRHLL